MKANLVRRVENFSLASTVPANTMIPLFEAIYNSLQSVLDQFGQDKWVESGRISVTRLGKAPTSFVVEDNGEGLTERNFEAFQEYDSPRKKTIGGKGIGRLSWLKVFDGAEVDSVFEEGGRRYRRSFGFVLDGDSPFRNYVLVEVAGSTPRRTTITLRNMRPSYEAHLPARQDTLVSRIVGHFLAYFVSDGVPDVIFTGDDGTVSIRQFVQHHSIQIGAEEFDDDGDQFRIEHSLLERALADNRAEHLVHLAAGDRIVRSNDVGNAIGLQTYVERGGKKYVYCSVVSGDALNTAVNTERTNFDLSAPKLERLNRKAIEAAQGVLGSDVQRVINRQSAIVRAVVKKFPRYSYLVQDTEEFSRDHLPRSANKAESVYQQLAVLDFRENRRVDRDVETLSKDTAALNEAVTEQTKALIQKVTSQEMSALADYTAKRKIIIDLLEKRLGYLPDGTMRRHSEEAIRSLICPVRVTSHDIDMDQHNLWLIDDKLTYYNFWASDKKIKTFITSDSDARPDIALFSGQTLFNRNVDGQPIVIVEFKKPARNNYDYEENPILQIYDYIDELKGKKVFDKSGAIIDDIPDKAPFFCYVIADFTENLRKYMRATQINLPLPGGSGYYGFNPDYNAFVQVLNYRTIVRDARLRNEAFFRRLNI